MHTGLAEQGFLESFAKATRRLSATCPQPDRSVAVLASSQFGPEIVESGNTLTRESRLEVHQDAGGGVCKVSDTSSRVLCCEGPPWRRWGAARASTTKLGNRV
eukprot:329848-Rhodomonas_salina.4